MEKRVVLAMVLSIGFLFVYYAFRPPTQPRRPETPVPVAGQPEPGPRQDGGQDPVGDGKGQDPGAPGNGAGDPKPAATAGVKVYPSVEDIVLNAERADWVFGSLGGALVRADVYGNPNGPAREDVHGDPGAGTGNEEGQPGALSVTLLAEGAPDLTAVPWGLTRSGSTVSAEMEALGLRLEKRFAPGSVEGGESYHGVLDISVSNPGGGAKAGRAMTLELIGPWMPHGQLPPIDDAVLVTRGVVQPDGSMLPEDPEDLTPTSIAEDLAENPAYSLAAENWAWIGMRRDFFLTAVRPLGTLPPGTTVSFRAKAIKTETLTHTAAPTLRIPFEVPAEGQSVTYRFMVYSGPNSHAVLGTPAYAELEAAVPTRMFSLAPIEATLAWLLASLASSGMGYGWAILCLTLFVRGAMFPLSRKSQISMRVHGKKMAILKPKMDAIKTKYKDPKKQQAKTMELMRSEKMSLLPGGCLIAFIQMPIWISLYGLLGNTFEMRYEGFLWFADLTAADHFMKLPFSIPLLGDWLNLLPILMMITWGISARLQPLPVDPQQRSQAKMMRWMPMMFGFFLYRYASGLCLYMTCSALWSIGEVNLIRHLWLKKIDEQFPTPEPAAE